MKFLLILIISLFSVACFAQTTKFKTGDIIFQSSQSKQAKAIELATHSRFSHVGIIIQQNGKFFVIEAVQPVSITPLDEFIARGKNNYYEVLRLKDASKITDANSKSMIDAGKKLVGKNYDLAFNWSDEEWYCSELVYKIYERTLKINLTTPLPLKSFDLTNPAVKEQLKVKYGNNIPLNEKMVSPQQIYDSKLLVKISD